ncbi:hypothetical protein BJ875DRAFT_473520 [Amylocarpus encephaloides]|uniref:Cell surface protein n=1 Tax=Amylocarpus encephaloides TaxID=45428 RepID=A0A9P7YBG5_9HELO|nr:hypothetical protein BJ875DRAFT_473520 [Amylocarpus encephaloides]
MSGIVNKVKNALHSDNTTTSTHHTTGTTTGTTHTGTAEGVAGPHSSRVVNTADPRVDSDLDGSRGVGGTSYGHTTGTTGSGLAGTHATHGTAGSGLTGTHNTHTTGSGLTGTHAGNTHGTHTGTTGGISHSTNAGPHNSNMANKVDPRVDSDLDGRGNRHGATTTGAGAGILGAHGSHATAGSGTAQNTAGPHNADLLNKIDPRVDSDRDGSKTYVGNKTHS